MSTNPPPPPAPPPPLLDTNTSLKMSPKGIDSSFSNVCVWASEMDVREACGRSNICLEQPPFQYKYKHCDPIIQVGPTCGLVALSMLLNGEVSPEELFEVVKAEGYSSNGEMFSCQNMAKLAEKALSLADINNVNVEVKTGLFSEEVVQELLEGATLLVAYDADCNHSPCLRNGHTAHWALVCGIIIVEEPKGLYTSDPNNVYVFCRHGKSRHLVLWPLAQLDKSNKNLCEFSPKKKEDGLLYIMPEGGMAGDKGLRDQFIVLKGL